MKADESEKKVDKKSFYEQKLELVRLRIRNGFYNKSDVLETVVNNLLKENLPDKKIRNRTK